MNHEQDCNADPAAEGQAHADEHHERRGVRRMANIAVRPMLDDGLLLFHDDGAGKRFTQRLEAYAPKHSTGEQKQQAQPQCRRLVRDRQPWRERRSDGRDKRDRRSNHQASKRTPILLGVRIAHRPQHNPVFANEREEEDDPEWNREWQLEYLRDVHVDKPDLSSQAYAKAAATRKQTKPMAEPITGLEKKNL